MSTLQEVLSLLLGAESEARREAEESRCEAERIISQTREAFKRERDDRITAAREQAQAIIGSAGSAAETEVDQILAMGRQEARAMEARFEAHAREVIDALVEETALQYIRQGTL